MPKLSDRNKVPKKGTTARKFVKRHNRDQDGRPQGKFVKAIPRSNEVAVITPLPRANKRANLDHPKIRAKGMKRDDI